MQSSQLRNQDTDEELASASVAYTNLGARLSLQDGNNRTQAKLVEDTIDWLETSKFIDSNFNVYDGAQVSNCDSSESAYTLVLLLFCP